MNKILRRKKYSRYFGWKQHRAKYGTSISAKKIACEIGLHSPNFLQDGICDWCAHVCKPFHTAPRPQRVMYEPEHHVWVRVSTGRFAQNYVCEKCGATFSMQFTADHLNDRDKEEGRR